MGRQRAPPWSTGRTPCAYPTGLRSLHFAVIRIEDSRLGEMSRESTQINADKWGELPTVRHGGKDAVPFDDKALLDECPSIYRRVAGEDI
jgi:hypothetical protein